ncbi:glutamate racemase [Thermosipho ferrireducens]|uniref:Glutamate racemase n=1 Tax=Thermosipho ferrireducens TaxID=2571116 RepID=A0ABX7S686_9BACT|nr:glutamate racemase [Thermosipho ferrireducens]QTA37341.1 glutamate racemase [Thermosipho ferrireducens]
MKIGLFDSGIGGVSVLKKLAYLNGAHYIYVADTDRAPYGIKTTETLERYIYEILSFLHQKGVSKIFAACNTTDSIILEKNINPGIEYHSIIEAGVCAVKSDMVGIIGTNITVQSATYKSRLEQLEKRVFQKATQLFVSLVEEGIFYGRMVEAVANFYLTPLKKKNIEELILGCTHFPFLKGIISRVLPNVRIIDPAEELSHNISVSKEKRAFVDFYVTGSSKEFERKLRRINFRIPYRVHNLDVKQIEKKVYTFEKAGNINRVIRSG